MLQAIRKMANALFASTSVMLHAITIRSPRDSGRDSGRDLGDCMVRLLS
jgi:hypothetical protein